MQNKNYFIGLRKAFLRYFNFGLVVCFAFSGQTEELQVPEGFKSEVLLEATKEFGSFTCLAFDDKGYLYAAGEKSGLTRFKVPGLTPNTKKLTGKRISSGISHAHGLLFHKNKLYAYAPGGIFVASKQDAEGNFAKTELKIKVFGKGGHGQHALLYNPNDDMIYAVAGNYCTVTDKYKSLAPPVWAEDHLVPRLADARGHGTKLMAPGATVIRFDENCQNLTMVAQGMRNPFGLALNRKGDMFTYDADMEYDMGTPWYRPTRVCHLVSGAEFGWRNGTGKWPEYFHDSLGPVINIGPGSPTHITSGTDANFPTRYRDALFISDWTFGFVYAIFLEDDGASYKAKKEIFVQGKPLPLTGLAIGPDGNMYIATGGRGMASKIYRVSYKGKQSTKLSIQPKHTDTAQLRLALEKFHGKQNPAAVQASWPHLNHQDRFVRFAARIAVENQAISTWRDLYYSEKDAAKIITLSIAMARHSKAEEQSKIIAKLSQINFTELSDLNQLALLRAYGVCISRLGKLNYKSRQAVIKQLNQHFPYQKQLVNHELSRVLCHLEAPEVIGKTLSLIDAAKTEKADKQLRELSGLSAQYGEALKNMAENAPQTQQIHYARMLTQVKSGWTTTQRQKYMKWFQKALNKKGGRSYAGHIFNMKKVALNHIPEKERDAFKTAEIFLNKKVDFSKLARAKGPGQAWTLELYKKLEKEKGLKGRSFDNGKKMFEAALCSSCHRFAADGNSIGPDLTSLGGRFDDKAIFEAILQPNLFISDQYAATTLTTKKGVFTGRIREEEGDVIRLFSNPYDPEKLTEVKTSDVIKREYSPVSMMPPGLIYSLNAEELLDFMAYLKSGGVKSHKYFKK